MATGPGRRLPGRASAKMAVTLPQVGPRPYAAGVLAVGRVPARVATGDAARLETASRALVPRPATAAPRHAQAKRPVVVPDGPGVLAEPAPPVVRLRTGAGDAGITPPSPVFVEGGAVALLRVPDPAPRAVPAPYAVSDARPPAPRVAAGAGVGPRLHVGPVAGQVVTPPLPTAGARARPVAAIGVAAPTTRLPPPLADAAALLAGPAGPAGDRETRPLAARPPGRGGGSSAWTSGPTYGTRPSTSSTTSSSRSSNGTGSGPGSGT